ncbi:MAG TPA: ABC transporter transmembrane domain-containing protein, partial [Sedimentisphaerales bacterium]|nr:ABC transporter transmembrane domain-containing protein [Sedimentisphaerales bacterium]
MDAFKRVFKYVWPQWPRLIIVFIAAFFFGAMFSLNFAAAVPILKVMLGTEGLHGWVNRSISQRQYGMTILVPDIFTFQADPAAAGYVQIAGVDPAAAAAAAGLQPNDRITAAGDTDGSYIDILRQLARMEVGQTVMLTVERGAEHIEMPLTLRNRAFYADWAFRLTDRVPIQDGVEDKRQAMMLLMMVVAFVTIVRCAGRFLQKYMGEKVVQTAIAEMREEAFSRAMHMPVACFESRNTSDSVSRLIRDSAEVGIGLKILLGTTLIEPMKAAWVMALAMVIDWRLTLIFTILAPPAIAAMAQFGRKIRRATRRSLESWSMILGKLEES